MSALQVTGSGFSRNLDVIVVPLLFAAALAWAPALHGAGFSVTKTDDSGAGSLRQAIIDANASGGADTISFNIPEDLCDAAGICGITLLTGLPEITGGTVIDGTTQPAYGTAPTNVCATTTAPLSPRVQISGDVDLLFLITSSDQVVIRGLTMGGPERLIRTEEGGNATIQCNLFGVSVDGTPLFEFATAVCIGCFGGAAPTLVGTDGDGKDDEGEGNVFANGTFGVNINTGNDNVIAGNWFGLLPDGVTRSDLSVGVFARQKASNNRIGSNLDNMSDDLERNVFANGQTGVDLVTDAGLGDRNLVVGNWFGIDATGSPAFFDTGIHLGDEGQDQVIAQNRFEDCRYAIIVDSSATMATTSVGNCFIDNVTGLSHRGSATGLAVMSNWWGDATGPSGLGAGIGDPIEVSGAGSVDFTPWLTIPPPGCGGTIQPYQIMIPAAATISGAAGSFFVTDVEVHNRNPSPATFVLKWLPRETDNSNPMTSTSFTLQPGSSRRFADVLSSVFGLSEVAGALVIESESDDLSAMSRTFNRGVEGTYGQALPGVPAARMVFSGERVRVVFMDENSSFRSNLGLVNGSGQPVTIRFQKYDHDGNLLDTDQRTLEPWSNTQVNRVFRDHAPIEAGYVVVWTNTPGGVFTCYGSVLDGQTSDPTTVLPE